MKLVIKHPPAEFTYDFFKYLVGKIKLYGLASIDTRKLIVFDTYINNKYKSVLKRHISSKDSLIMFFYNLKITTLWDRVIIEVNPNIVIPSTTIKLINVVKLITYGNLEIKGYNIIPKVFKYVKENINELYEMYQRGL